MGFAQEVEKRTDLELIKTSHISPGELRSAYGEYSRESLTCCNWVALS